MGDVDEIVEGWLESDDGSAPKRLDRILNKQVLENAVKVLTQKNQLLNSELNRHQKDIVAQQDLLNQNNELFLKRQDEFAQLKSQVCVELSGKEQLELHCECEDAVAEYFEEKPLAEDFTDVEVCFRDSDNETMSLSNDAKFRVRASDPIRRLAEQAAKYWGLDPTKVFFLDRDQRVIPEEMIISDIILPPNSEYVIRQKNYVMTLVRAGAEFNVSAPGEAEGEKWNDFTFDNQWLKEELKKNRESRGDTEAELDEIDPSTAIPSLADLIARGKSKRARLAFDTKMRVLEASTFVVLFILYHLSILQAYFATPTMRQSALVIADQLQAFTHDNTAKMFNDIQTPDEIQSWFHTAAFDVFEKNVGHVEERGLRIIGEVELREYGVDAPPCLQAGGAENACRKISSCSERAGGIYTPVRERNRFWPPCVAEYSYDYMSARAAASKAGATYSFIIGNFTTYGGGQAKPRYLATSVKSQFVAFYDSHLDPLWSNMQRRALLLSAFIYSEFDGIIIFQVYFERSMVGHFSKKMGKYMIDLEDAAPMQEISIIIVMILGFVILVMELRRIIRPRYVEEKERFDIWTLLYVILICIVGVNYVLLTTRNKGADASLSALVKGRGMNADISASHFDKLFESVTADYLLRVSECAVIIVLNLLLFRYVLGWFPQLSSVKVICEQVIPPIMVSTFFVICFLFCFVFLNHATFGYFSENYAFPMTAAATTMKMAMGGVHDWTEINQENPEATAAASVIGFFIFSLCLKSLPIAILVAYKKQLTMEYHSQYHPLWLNKNSTTFDPSSEFDEQQLF